MSAEVLPDAADLTQDLKQPHGLTIAANRGWRVEKKGCSWLSSWQSKAWTVLCPIIGGIIKINMFWNISYSLLKMKSGGKQITETCHFWIKFVDVKRCGSMCCCLAKLLVRCNIHEGCTAILKLHKPVAEKSSTIQEWTKTFFSPTSLWSAFWHPAGTYTWVVSLFWVAHVGSLLNCDIHSKQP